MKKLKILPVLLLMLPVIVFGQYSVMGTMTDKKSKAPLSGGKIYIMYTKGIAATDKDGHYSIPGLPNGTCSLKAAFLGYESIETEFVLRSDTVINFEMEQKPILAEEVIITGLRAGEKTPVTFQNISGEKLEEQNHGQDLPVLIENSPSVTVSTDAGSGTGYTYLRIRGINATRINVTINGIPYNDPESHEVYWVDLPDIATSLENIQLQRGVGTSSNGSAAFGASINLQTTSFRQEPFAKYTGSAGSFNTFKNTLSFGSGLINKNFEFNGRISGISSDGYIDRAFSNLKSFFISGGYYLKESFLKFNIFSGHERTYQAWNGVPKIYLDSARTYNPFTYSNQVDDYQQDHYELFFSNEINDRLNLTIAAFNIRGKGYYENFQDRNDPYIYAAPDVYFSGYGLNDIIIGSDTIVSSDMVTRKWLKNNFYGANLALNYDDNAVVKLNYGASYNRYDGYHFGKIIWAEYAGNGFIDKPWYDNTGNRFEFSTFLKAGYQMTEKLNIYGDLQCRNIYYRISGIHDNLLDISQSHNFIFFNPKAGIFIDIDSQNNFYASVAVANREPNRSNYEDARPGEVPEPERLYDYELGYNFKSSNFNSSANIYYMDYNDQLVLTGKINDVGAPVMTNVEESFRQGIELTADMNIVKQLAWEGNLTLSRNKIKNFTEYVDDWDNGGQIQKNFGTTDISFSPSVIGSSRFTFKPAKNLNLSLISKYAGRQYIDNTSSEERMLDPYFINNLLVSYNLKTKYVNDITFTLLVNNIFSVKYETNAWVYSYYYGGTRKEMDGYFPQAPANFLAGIKLKF